MYREEEKKKKKKKKWTRVNQENEEETKHTHTKKTPKTNDTCNIPILVWAKQTTINNKIITTIKMKQKCQTTLSAKVYLNDWVKQQHAWKGPQ